VNWLAFKTAMCREQGYYEMNECQFIFYQFFSSTVPFVIFTQSLTHISSGKKRDVSGFFINWSKSKQERPKKRKNSRVRSSLEGQYPVSSF